MLKIANKIYNNTLIQGPLAGFTCAPMRIQTWKYSQPAYCSTEMISANQLVYAKKPQTRYLERSKHEGALCFQLSASDKEVLAKATRIANRLEPEIIELNCGCPVNKIRKKGAGSKLLTDLDKLSYLISALRENTHAAVSIKMRVRGDDQTQDDIKIAKLAEQLGVDLLVVHGRHHTERYDKACRLDQIAQIVNAVNIPVIGNGDVKDLNSLQNMLKTTGCRGIMIARQATGQPWIFDKLQHELQNKPYSLPCPEEIGCIFIDHIERLAAIDNHTYRALLQARTLGKYYARNHIQNPSEFNQHLMQLTQMKTFHKLIKTHFV